MATFDTLAAARELERAGFERKQAEALANTFSKLNTEHLATKADLYQVALAVVLGNAAITFGLLKLLLP